MKLFDYEKTDTSVFLTILGIKIKYTSQRKLNKLYNKKIFQLEHEVSRLTNGDRYIWQNRENITPGEFKKLIEKKFYEMLGYFPDLQNPKTFNEKINWLKLNNYNPIENICADKATFKEYLKEKSLENCIVPNYGVYESVEEIDFDKLPEQVVFKNTITGGANGVIIIKNKSKTDMEKLKYDLNNLLLAINDTYANCLVPERKEIKQRLIAEKYLEQQDGQLYDYKISCFNGEPQFIELCLDRYTKKGLDVLCYDVNWNVIPPRDKFHRCSGKIFPRPENLDKMLEISRKIAADFPFVRVDLYDVNNNIFVGELTFNPSGGYEGFSYEEDLKIGELLNIENILPANPTGGGILRLNFFFENFINIIFPRVFSHAM